MGLQNSVAISEVVKLSMGNIMRVYCTCNMYFVKFDEVFKLISYFTIKDQGLWCNSVLQPSKENFTFIKEVSLGMEGETRVLTQRKPETFNKYLPSKWRWQFIRNLITSISFLYQMDIYLMYKFFSHGVADVGYSFIKWIQQVNIMIWCYRNNCCSIC